HHSGIAVAIVVGRLLGDDGTRLVHALLSSSVVEFVASGTTSVPAPRSLNTSTSVEWGTRPSMIAAFGTPPDTASRQAVIFGIIPASRDGSSAVSSETVIWETRESRSGQSR